MIETPFRNGMKLKAIHFTDDTDIYANDSTQITVVMEAGQMALVPWAIVNDGNRIHQWNLAHVLGVELEAEE